MDASIKTDYDFIISNGKEDQINWSQIEFIDFIYIFNDSYAFGEKDCLGRLSFKFNNEVYNCEINALYVGDGYKIWSIGTYQHGIGNNVYQ